ncbi:MAG: hypothetical protein K0R59_214 [Sphingobacterium sp.]|jgi:transposase-like protein|nr:hypothetical protein [Sphingobacterium sp.]
MREQKTVRYSRLTKENVVNAIVNGELWLEEAMHKYAVHEREIVIKWLRKYQREKKKAMLNRAI